MRADNNIFRSPLTDRKDELAKRAALFDIAGSAAGMFSGYLMAGLLSLNGRHGLKGWQW
jgi:hypothetical protein